MFGINAKLPKKYFSCEMCSGPCKLQHPYVYGNFAIPPKHVYEEMQICKACALREHGNIVYPHKYLITKEFASQFRVQTLNNDIKLRIIPISQLENL